MKSLSICALLVAVQSSADLDAEQSSLLQLQRNKIDTKQSECLGGKCDPKKEHPPPEPIIEERPPMKIPESNCMSPSNAKTCHFWGDPHFTHLFHRTNDDREAHKGGRMHGTKLHDFNPSGVFQLATSADGEFEAQAFFCPAYGSTTTGVGMAMRFGQDIIQIIRGEVTGPRSEEKAHNLYFADLGKKDQEHEFTTFYVNGEKKAWSELGSATDKQTRGNQVKGEGGVSTPDAYLQQMKTEHESSRNILPVCAGDGGKNLVEVSTPWFNSTSGRRVYEHAMTIRSSNPGAAGICADKTGDLLGNEKQFRVYSQKNLFSTKQMKLLCQQCRLPLAGGVCGAPSFDVTPEAVCKETGANINAAKKACKAAEFEEGTTWFGACVLEACAAGDALEQAVSISKIEETVALKMDERDDSKEKELDCAKVTGAVKACPSQQTWAGDGGCPVLVNTEGTNCKQFCQKQKLVCVKAHDNVADTCTRDDRTIEGKKQHQRQTTAENGCLQNWHNQVCVCGKQ